MRLISAPSKPRGRWKRQAGHGEHPLHLWCHASCLLIQVPGPRGTSQHLSNLKPAGFRIEGLGCRGVGFGLRPYEA